MAFTIRPNSSETGFSILQIIKAGLLAGSLDISSAFLYSYIKRGTAPATVLQYISKLVLGKTTFTDTTLLTISGLLIHFIIAMGWAIIFFILYPRLKLMRQNKIVTGIIYGLFVWAMMNMIILPWWNHKPFVFNPESSSINAAILIIAIGLPLSFLAGHYHAKNKSLSQQDN